MLWTVLNLMHAYVLSCNIHSYTPAQSIYLSVSQLEKPPLEVIAIMNSDHDLRT